MKRLVNLIVVSLVMASMISLNAQTHVTSDKKLSNGISELITKAQEFSKTTSGVLTTEYKFDGSEKVVFSSKSLRFYLADGTKINTGLTEDGCWMEATRKSGDIPFSLKKSATVKLTQNKVFSWLEAMAKKGKVAKKEEDK